jgi:hypothetical protein
MLKFPILSGTINGGRSLGSRGFLPRYFHILVQNFKKRLIPKTILLLLEALMSKEKPKTLVRQNGN